MGAGVGEHRLGSDVVERSSTSRGRKVASLPPRRDRPEARRTGPTRGRLVAAERGVEARSARHGPRPWCHRPAAVALRGQRRRLGGGVRRGAARRLDYQLRRGRRAAGAGRGRAASAGEVEQSFVSSVCWFRPSTFHPVPRAQFFFPFRFSKSDTGACILWPHPRSLVCCAVACSGRRHRTRPQGLALAGRRPTRPRA